MIWRIELKDKPGIFDAIGEGIKKDILDLNIKDVTHVEFIPVYTLTGNITKAQAETIARKLLVDPIVQTYKIRTHPIFSVKQFSNYHIVEVAYNPGVMD
ncbi:MAG: phosphoribosylformylglycinamidine synthase subunit PurS, partial [Candidatus Omnitrophica bacterium]|nr:phosphoribosylformylglycinamidine synthase subunit PurS [Candidatus Omnitrophota bacterium]